MDLFVREIHLINLNPNRKAATKGGSTPGFFQTHYANPQKSRAATPDQSDKLVAG